MPVQLFAEEAGSEQGQIGVMRDVGQELTIIGGAGTVAEAEQALNKLNQYLESYLSTLDPGSVTEVSVEVARIALETERLNTASLKSDRVGVNNRVAELDIVIEKAESDYNKYLTVNREDREGAASLKRELEEKIGSLESEKSRLSDIDQWIIFSEKKIALAERYWSQLDGVYRARQEVKRQLSLDELQQQLEDAQRELKSELAELHARFSTISGSDAQAEAQRHLLNLGVEEAKDHVHVLRVQLAIEKAKATLDALPAVSSESAVDLLKTAQQSLAQAEREIQSLQSLTGEKTALLKLMQTLMTKSDEIISLLGKEYKQRSRELADLISNLTKQSEQLNATLITLGDKQALIEDAFQQATTKNLTVRQKRLSYDALRNFALQLRELPTAFIVAASKTISILVTGIEQLDVSTLVFLVIPILLFAVFLVMIGRIRFSSGLTPDLSFTVKSERIALALVRRTSLTLFVAGSLLYAGWLLNMQERSFSFLILLSAVVIGFQLVSGLSYWLLVSPVVDERHREPSLHRWVYGISFIIAMFVLFVELGHLGYVEKATLNVLDRGFMLLLLPLGYLVFRMRTILRDRVDDQWQGVFWIRLIGIVSLLGALSVLATAIIGLVGYVNLALFLARNLVMIAAILVGWAVCRHLVIDFSEWVVRRVQKNALRPGFWIEIAINPLQSLAQVGLFLVAVYLLATLAGWHNPSSWLKTWATYPLFSFGSSNITVLGTLQAGLFLYLAIMVGRWFQIFSRDWLYAGVVDEALRNSLSVFTQYVVVVLGVFIGLTLLGIDLTSLTVFAGALGVGIGFGLQAISNNFISGLILLAERPVRMKDWVTIGGEQGRVSRIGSRSLTVTTWDNQDVIIPNGDLISNAFTNWTLSNSLVRTVFVVGIRYQDDPHQAQKIIEEAVMLQPEVSLEMQPRVMLTEFNTSSVDFRVEFYSDVLEHSRLVVKSNVMFSIWDALKEADIGIPFPQQDIYIKEIPESGKVLPAGSDVLNPGVTV